ncbi:hypothetical protein [Streptosporangium roseum]|uniref:Uncharacterized protein n=1 Tax=Streptosporangium roseum (strain ATCC 12428 / DSM 43021 / JCM 3005 / KCTC 9067 / NCIMB 10171 / NRRL 2505 / NI 9100) TaxID=479432 RepID=D2BA09_STRRD|nr:hypothetical protein [Streptosporangium roseum]ACZ86022.1 hypothetical protein Sros_3072 [Streptosporangium roseum DSM 43021]
MLSRRQFALGSLALGVLGTTGTARAAAGYDYTARETFDLFDKVFHSSGALGQPTDHNEQGGLGWGQSYALAAFIRMYEAYQDTSYLDRLIHNADLMLAMRDSERGVADYRGLSLPVWRNRSYTAGGVTLLDPAGQPLLEVRSALTNVDDAVATVRAGTSEDRFTLEVANAPKAKVSTFANLTMDPAGPDYAVRRVLDAYPSATMVTVRDLRDSPAAGPIPALGTAGLAASPAHFSVHTGMITYPLASFVRIVYRTPGLRRDRRYKAKADEYLAAVRDAAAVHDREWVQNDAGLGHFIWPKGMPVPYDGTEQPINQSLGLGQTYAELAAATGDPTYLDRTRRLARAFAGDLKVDADDAYVWPYWPTFGKLYNGYTKADDVSEYTPSYGSPGKGAQQVEDLSHGAIDVEFAALAFRRKIHYRGRDMERFARTYTKNLATSDNGVATTLVRVDGTGALATAGQYLQAPRWMPVAQWDETLFTHARAVYDDHAVESQYGSTLLCVAYLNWHARRRG